MKRLFKIVLLSFSLIFTACSSDDDSNPIVSNSTEIQTIINAVETGSWTITYFYDTDTEETSNYNGYEFIFGANGVLTASNGTNTYTGTWSVLDSSSNSSSSSSNDIDFNILFASPVDFQELSDDWDIVSHTSTIIELTDVSGGNGGTDFLTFVKQ